MSGKRKLSFAFKVATVVCCSIGILSNLSKTSSIKSILSFYTIQSNIFVLMFYIGYFILKIFKPNIEKTKQYHIFKGATIMVISLTLVIYTISLQPIDFSMDVGVSSSNIFKASNLCVHFITPIMVLLDYLIFDEKGYFKNSYVLIWSLFPALYLVYVYTYAHFGGHFFSIGGSEKYAYFFLDIDKIGINGVLSYLLLIIAFYILCSLLLIQIDRLLRKRRKN